MPEFSVSVIDTRSRRSWRRIQAVSQADLLLTLKKQGLWVIGAPKELHRGRTSFNHKLPLSVVQGILEQLILMLESGVGIQIAIERLADQYPKGGAKFFLTQVASRISVNGDISESFGQFPKIFAAEEVAMMKPAQNAATLTPLLKRLVEQLSRRSTIRATVKSATLYPAMVGSLGGLVFILSMTILVPKLKELILDLAVKPPPLTRALFATSDFLLHRGWVLAAGIVVGVFLIRYLLTLTMVRRFFERLLLSTPRVREAVAALTFAQLFSNIGMLYGAGIPLEQVVSSVVRAIGLSTYRKALETAHVHLKLGIGLAKSLEAAKEFPPMVVAMVGTGEETGRLEIILDKLADYYAKEGERAVQLALKLVEPLLTFILAAFVGWILVSIFQPLASIYENMGKL